MLICILLVCPCSFPAMPWKCCGVLWLSCSPAVFGSPLLEPCESPGGVTQPGAAIGLREVLTHTFLAVPPDLYGMDLKVDFSYQ